jgi:hypothetical protein
MDGLEIRDGGVIGAQAANLARSNGHVAMPVRWIYQLADGTLGTIAESASGGGSTGAGFSFSAISGNGEPSAANPMVARFAFWADDETAKLNMNVHAGGLAWDIPKAGGELDMAMGKFQPAQKEWQRYPGHPATTHLIPALAPGVLDIVNDRDAMEMLFAVVPRVVGGGSESGTRVIDTRNIKEANGLIPDTEPLFPSLDDVVMRSDRTPHQFPNAQGDPIPPDQLSEYLERAKFFVTVSSRAPETNLFNKPKIAMWPIFNANPGNITEYKQALTPFDRLIHFCASVGKNDGGGQYQRHEYIFKRQRADSATFDIENIPRNAELYAYLLTMLDEPIPGYGGSFSEKYGPQNTRQIATMMFDYIRSTNLHDDTLFENFELAFAQENNTTYLTYTNPRDLAEKGFGHKGHGQVTPIVINANINSAGNPGSASVETKGMGRFYSIAGADIVVASVGETGFRPNSMYPGVTEYNRGVIEPPTGNLFTNLPPLPPRVAQGGPNTVDPTILAQWPNWLHALKTSDPMEFAAAFDPAQWNWQLAFLDPAYLEAVRTNPTVNKFNQALITKGGCEMMRLNQGERLVQAAFVFNMFCPSIGWGSINPDMEVHIKRENGMRFGNHGFIGFEGSYGPAGDPDGITDTFVWATNWAKPHRQGGARSWGGLLSFGYTMSAQQPLQPSDRRQLWVQMANQNLTLNNAIRSRLTPIDKGYNSIRLGLESVSGRGFGMNKRPDIAQAYRYDLVTLPFKVSGPTIQFDGGTVNFKVFNGGKHTEGTARRTAGPDLVQDVTIEFPRFVAPSPVMSPGFQGYVNEFVSLSHNSHNAVELASLTADPGNPFGSLASKANRRPGRGRGNVEQAGSRSMVGRMALLTNHWDSGGTYIRDGDVVRSVAIQHGDMRIAAARRVIVPGDNIFGPHRDYFVQSNRMAHSLTTSSGVALSGYAPGSPSNKPYLIIPDLPNNASPYRNVIPLAIAGSRRSNEVQLFGDFDNGAGLMVDGPYINKPDEGNVHSLKTKFTQEIMDYWEARRNYGEFPYFSNPDIAEAGGPAYFSPNRIISGPGMFGSLPSAALDLSQRPSRPWQTLLFRPNVVGNGYLTHPGAKDSDWQGRFLDNAPPDHVLMDLFWMPVVEPYAISEPLSTAGKINMNYQIVPFLHVHRDTALRGVFRSELILCVPNQWHRSYKHDFGRGQGYHWRDNPFGGELQGKRLRAAIVEDDTLRQFDQRFNAGLDAFKSATEICEIHLIPEESSRRLRTGSKGSIGSYTPSVQQMQNGKYWRDHSLVGDNSRERPYTNIQTRLTTKSNTFQVHYRAQVIKQARRDSDAEYGQWRPSTDTVQAEYRGSSVVERYVDPNGVMPDFADRESPSIDEFYRFRVINPRRFAP